MSPGAVSCENVALAASSRDEHAEHRRPGPPASARREVPERPPRRCEPERRARRSAGGSRSASSGTPSHRNGAGAEPARGPTRLERLVAQPLDADGAEDRHGDHREVAHASRVVQVDVAEGDAQHEVAHPGGRDDGVEHQDPGERRALRRTPRRARDGGGARSASGTPSRIVGAGVRARRGAERQRPRRPDAVRLEGAGVVAAEGADRVAESVVAGREARRLEGVHARQQDREGEHRQRDEEHRRAAAAAPVRQTGAGRCLVARLVGRAPTHRDDPGDEVGRRRAPCTPRARGSGARWRPATTRARRARCHARRADQRARGGTPAAPTRATVVHAIAPANGIEIAISEVDISIASESPPAVAASRRQPLDPQEPVEAEPRDERVRDDEGAHRDGGGQLREQAPSAAGRAIRPAGPPRSGSRPSRRGSTAARAGGERASEEREAREPEREDVGVGIAQPVGEDEAPQREQHTGHDQGGTRGGAGHAAGPRGPARGSSAERRGLHRRRAHGDQAYGVRSRPRGRRLVG